MGALQPVLTFLLAPSAWPVPLSALDLAAVALAMWVGWAGRMAPGRARALLLAGVLAAGLGPLLASAAMLVPAGTGPASEVASKTSVDAPGACAVVGLLLVAAGCARLECSTRGARRRAHLLEAFCLVVTAAGVVVALLAASTPSGVSLAVGTTLLLSYLAAAGWAVALAGAVGVVAADASGHASGPVPYRRRVFMVLAAAVYAAVVAAITALGAWGTGVPGAIAFLTHLAHVAALLLLAWSVHRVLDRPAAADYWRGEGVPSARKRHDASRGRVAVAASGSPRIVPTPPSMVVSPARHTPGGLAGRVALAGSSVPFTPPALRRSLLLQSASVSAPSRVVGAGSPMAAVEQGAAVPVGLSEAASAGGDTNRLVPGSLDTDPAPRAPLSPQFVAALLHLQAEMLRAGRTYSFEELVELFAEVHPRASLGPRHTRPLRDVQPAPEADAAFAPADEAPLSATPPPGDDNNPPTTPRFRLNIVP
jgi:hypothetical protein